MLSCAGEDKIRYPMTIEDKTRDTRRKKTFETEKYILLITGYLSYWTVLWHESVCQVMRMPDGSDSEHRRFRVKFLGQK